jgi:flavin reductase (DIM6/NTAB) family NADH-FMN oxidoreductase RutF
MQSPYLTDSVVESPVGLVLVQAGARANAATMSFFSEVAHHPTTLWVSIARASYTHALLEETGAFTVATLHQRQREIALACGAVSGREKDKCAALDLYESAPGFLFLRDAMASTACRIRQRAALEDHTLFIADILSGDFDSRRIGLRHLLLSDLVGP